MSIRTTETNTKFKPGDFTYWTGSTHVYKIIEVKIIRYERVETLCYHYHAYSQKEGWFDSGWHPVESYDICMELLTEELKARIV
jgi:hypothetical protein